MEVHKVAGFMGYNLSWLVLRRKNVDKKSSFNRMKTQLHKKGRELRSNQLKHN